MRRWFARHPLSVAVTARVVAAAAVFAVTRIAGPHEIDRALHHIRGRWLPVVLAAQAVSLPAYVLAYRSAIVVTTGRRLRRRLTVELVLAGFGPFAFSSGFSFDDRLLQRLGLDARLALRTVLDLGGLEFIALVWLAFSGAVAALWVRALSPGLIWPWLIAVPVGTALAVALARVEPPERVPSERVVLHELAAGLRDVLGIARHPVRSRGCWPGMLVYWVTDMASLYAALRLFDLDPAWQSVVLAYATGYLLSRRSLPLGGAGFVEVLLTLSLYLTGLPLAPALAAVILYRMATLALAIVPAVVSRLRLRALDELVHPFDDP